MNKILHRPPVYQAIGRLEALVTQDTSETASPTFTGLTVTEDQTIEGDLFVDGAIRGTVIPSDVNNYDVVSQPALTLAGETNVTSVTQVVAVQYTNNARANLSFNASLVHPTAQALCTFTVRCPLAVQFVARTDVVGFAQGTDTAGNALFNTMVYAIPGTKLARVVVYVGNVLTTVLSVHIYFQIEPWVDDTLYTVSNLDGLTSVVSVKNRLDTLGTMRRWYGVARCTPESGRAFTYVSFEVVLPERVALFATAYDVQWQLSGADVLNTFTVQNMQVVAVVGTVRAMVSFVISGDTNDYTINFTLSYAI